MREGSQSPPLKIPDPPLPSYTVTDTGLFKRRLKTKLSRQIAVAKFCRRSCMNAAASGRFRINAVIVLYCGRGDGEERRESGVYCSQKNLD